MDVNQRAAAGVENADLSKDGKTPMGSMLDDEGQPTPEAQPVEPELAADAPPKPDSETKVEKAAKTQEPADE